MNKIKTIEKDKIYCLEELVDGLNLEKLISHEGYTMFTKGTTRYVFKDVIKPLGTYYQPVDNYESDLDLGKERKDGTR